MSITIKLKNVQHICAFFVIQTFVYHFTAVTKLHIASHSLTVQLYSTVQ